MLITHILVWSNFEIGDLNFWRGEAYTKYFEHLDKAGGFYYEVLLSLWVHIYNIHLAHSGGEMLPCIVSALHYLPVRTRFTSSTTLGIGMNLSNIVHKARLMLGASAGAKKVKTSIMNGNSHCASFLPSDLLFMWTQVLVFEAVR